MHFLVIVAGRLLGLTKVSLYLRAVILADKWLCRTTNFLMYQASKFKNERLFDMACTATEYLPSLYDYKTRLHHKWLSEKYKRPCKCLYCREI